MQIIIYVLQAIWIVAMVFWGLWALTLTFFQAGFFETDDAYEIPIIKLVIIWLILFISIVLFVIFH